MPAAIDSHSGNDQRQRRQQPPRLPHGGQPLREHLARAAATLRATRRGQDPLDPRAAPCRAPPGGPRGRTARPAPPPRRPPPRQPAQLHRAERRRDPTPATPGSNSSRYAAKKQQHRHDVEQPLEDDRRERGGRAQPLPACQQIRAQELAGPGRQQEARRKADDGRAERRARNASGRWPSSRYCQRSARSAYVVSVVPSAEPSSRSRPVHDLAPHAGRDRRCAGTAPAGRPSARATRSVRRCASHAKRLALYYKIDAKSMPNCGDLTATRRQLRAARSAAARPARLCLRQCLRSRACKIAAFRSATRSPDVPPDAPLLQTSLAGLALHPPRQGARRLRGRRRLLIVATDRISAFDYVLGSGHSRQGPGAHPAVGVLVRPDGRPRAEPLISIDARRLSRQPHALHADVLAGPLDARAPRDAPCPIECVVRGYLAGSGWAEYRATGAVCGIALPPGLRESDRLPAADLHAGDEGGVGPRHQHQRGGGRPAGRPRPARAAPRPVAARSTRAASPHAESRGIIVADTKFEFGLLRDGAGAPSRRSS